MRYQIGYNRTDSETRKFVVEFITDSPKEVEAKFSKLERKGLRPTIFDTQEKRTVSIHAILLLVSKGGN